MKIFEWNLWGARQSWQSQSKWIEFGSIYTPTRYYLQWDNTCGHILHFMSSTFPIPYFLSSFCVKSSAAALLFNVSNKNLVRSRCAYYFSKHYTFCNKYSLLFMMIVLLNFHSFVHLGRTGNTLSSILIFTCSSTCLANSFNGTFTICESTSDPFA